MIVYGCVARDGPRALGQLGGVARRGRARAASSSGIASPTSPRRVDHDDRLERRAGRRAPRGSSRPARRPRRRSRATRSCRRPTRTPRASSSRRSARRPRRSLVMPKSAYVHSGPGRAQDRDAVARLDAEVDQAAADLRHDLAELGVADVAATRRRACSGSPGCRRAARRPGRSGRRSSTTRSPARGPGPRCCSPWLLLSLPEEADSMWRSSDAL